MVEVNPDGTGLWCAYESFVVAPGETETRRFPEGLSAYWVRVKVGGATKAITAARHGDGIQQGWTG